MTEAGAGLRPLALSATTPRASTVRAGVLGASGGVAPTPASTKAEDDGTYVEFSRGGLRLVQEQTPGERAKEQIHDIGQTMLHYMMATYPREIWDACEIWHPDRERERERLALEAAKELAAQQAAEKIRGLAQIFQQNVNQHEWKKQAIPFRDERQESLAAIQEERAAAWLAKQSGWTVLDVEEVHDLFLRYATDGTISLTSNAFLALVRELYSETTEEDMRVLYRDIRDVRRQTLAWRRKGLKAPLTRPNSTVRVEDPVIEDRHELRFSEFYLALVRWLEGQIRAKKLFKYCSLARFSSKKKKEPPSWISRRALRWSRRHRAMSGGLDAERDEDDEVDEAIRQERGNPLRESLLVTVFKEEYAKKLRERAALAESSPQPRSLRFAGGSEEVPATAAAAEPPRSGRRPTHFRQLAPSVAAATSEAPAQAPGEAAAAPGGGDGAAAGAAGAISEAADEADEADEELKDDDSASLSSSSSEEESSNSSSSATRSSQGSDNELVKDATSCRSSLLAAAAATETALAVSRLRRGSLPPATVHVDPEDLLQMDVLDRVVSRKDSQHRTSIIG